MGEQVGKTLELLSLKHFYYSSVSLIFIISTGQPGGQSEEVEANICI